MRRDFQGQLCAYCRRRQSEAEDHVVGRGFIPERLRGNLPKAPACDDCNSRKAALERYAMAVFPFGAVDPVGAEMLRTRAKQRLAKDQRLLREIQEGKEDVLYVSPDGTQCKTLAIPFDWRGSFELFEMLILGLLWHLNRSPLPDTHAVRLLALTESGREWFRGSVLALSPDKYQEMRLGGGAFSYRFTHNAEDAFFSAWILDVYGSLNICASTEDGRLFRVFVAALTGPDAIGGIADRIEELGSRTGNVVTLPRTAAGKTDGNGRAGDDDKYSRDDHERSEVC